MSATPTELRTVRFGHSPDADDAYMFYGFHTGEAVIDGCKVAGLLNEMSAESDRIRFVVLGIGVNLNMTADQFPADLRMPATSLLLAGGHTVARAAFARELLRQLDTLIHLLRRGRLENEHSRGGRLYRRRVVRARNHPGR